MTMRRDGVRWMRVASAAVTVAAVLVTAACSHDRMPHANPASHQTATVMIDTSDLPVNIEKVRLEVAYTVANLDCIKPMAFSGAIPTPQTSLKFSVDRTSKNTFEAKVPLDPFKDEDYDGLGLCHWEMSIATFTMPHDGRRFEASINGPVDAPDTQKRYFSSWSFTSAPVDALQTGLWERDALPASPDVKIYSVTLSIKNN